MPTTLWSRIRMPDDFVDYNKMEDIYIIIKYIDIQLSPNLDYEDCRLKMIMMMAMYIFFVAVCPFLLYELGRGLYMN